MTSLAPANGLSDSNDSRKLSLVSLVPPLLREQLSVTSSRPSTGQFQRFQAIVVRIRIDGLTDDAVQESIASSKASVITTLFNTLYAPLLQPLQDAKITLAELGMNRLTAVVPLETVAQAGRVLQTLIAVEKSIEATLDKTPPGYPHIHWKIAAGAGIGNVSTNAAVTAASANSSVFSVYGALLAGLIGPNHGGAASFGVHYLFSLAKAAGFDASDDVLARIAGGRIDKKSPIWCVGHRILRGEDGDPRATAVINLLEECFSDNRLFRLAQRWYPLAIEQLKSKKPEVAFQAVNIDSYSGVALHAAGIIADYRMAAFAGLIFAVSRIAGAGAEIFWHAAAGKPKLIRPSASNWDELEARTGGVSG
ncbi:MAG: hypothetical protein DCC75_10775 [Proteobacteria bacterium]|nr:MAG: hypothetical protein DCC75_10775 [Pseudomonadota bacterium]